MSFQRWMMTLADRRWCTPGTTLPSQLDSASTIAALGRRRDKVAKAFVLRTTNLHDNKLMNEANVVTTAAHRPAVA